MATIARASAFQRATCTETPSNSARIPAVLAKPAAKVAFGVSSNAKSVSLRQSGAAMRTLNVATATTTTAASADKPTYDDFSRLLEQYDFKFNVGDKIVGNVFNIDQRGAYVDIGAKAAAFLPTSEASLAPISKVADVVEVGQSREFLIINSNDMEGSLTLSLRRMQIEIAWKRVNQLHQEDVTVYGTVVSTNRGGLLVEVEGLRGFLPASQLNIPTPREELIGQSIPVKLIEVDEERQRLVMSNKRATADKQLESFQVGDVVVGTVQAVKPYGAFVDIGGMNGLLHISQISHERITSVENVLNLGDQLKVMILSQDRERGRVSLSTRKLEPTPGDMLRDPQLVFEKADEMAATFRERVAAAEAAARAEEAALSDEGAALESSE
mmetsp:Transcript_14545/g.31160  ORF Transcript_14545/g.31160 Transcript_14545/m.31160 type:complete len:384 (-) Transcript_14545:249-1400(-)|eukprot:CAMPEP_0118932126 /NCGR_PEP_ID=MMETSP1169-20130426/9166_1 /TAXON_ID=36882 /ORGANISM="Pyramimonas obovata, Strain CCMP722" /LENGTH=383 /DNA_ID=CAMNT_0006874733 /DNA_START=56 /DNA_END=1207 /DNA_ORIENTATION=-